MKRTGWAWSGVSDPLALQMVETALPVPTGDDVLVANHAVALNPVDWKVLGSTALGWEAGHVPGVDAAGVVLACGPLANVAEGTRVMYHQDLMRDGSFATHTLVAAKALHALPEKVSFAEAATIPCPGLTVSQALAKVPDAPGRDVLVIGGGAATGTFLVQLAAMRGYRVWTTASPEHRTALLKFGAIGVLDYHHDAWREMLEKALDGRRLYAAFDTIGEQHARSLVPLIGYSGHLVCIQGRVNTPVMPEFSTVVSQHEVALGAIYRYGAPEDWAQLHSMGDALSGHVAAGTLKTPTRTAFHFSNLPQALAGLKSGTLRGKLVANLYE
jgi:NADPH:quinone reductase-like Zn-dependent oxidoreductase